jgi:hypothetical protein
MAGTISSVVNTRNQIYGVRLYAAPLIKFIKSEQMKGGNPGPPTAEQLKTIANCREYIACLKGSGSVGVFPVPENQVSAYITIQELRKTIDALKKKQRAKSKMKWF